jgi:hypothetical protein
LAYQTTLLIDTFLWLATGLPPINDASPAPDAEQTLLALRRSTGLPSPPANHDLGKIRFSDYEESIHRLLENKAWRDFALATLDRAKWRNRDGVAVWASAMLTTGESADALNRLALLNEGVSTVQKQLRLSTPEAATAVERTWLDWHAEAISLREDLHFASRGTLSVEWESFRWSLRPADQAELQSRTEKADESGSRRRLLSQPFKELRE